MCSDLTTLYLFLMKQAVSTSRSARYFKNSPSLSNLTLFPCFRGLIKLQRWMTNPCGMFTWILESHPGNPFLRLSYFWEIRVNLKLFNRVYIFPPNQNCQPLVKNKSGSLRCIPLISGYDLYTYILFTKHSFILVYIILTKKNANEPK